jgi:hypothetical protein
VSEKDQNQKAAVSPEIVLTQGGAADASTGRLGSTVHHEGGIPGHRGSAKRKRNNDVKGATHFARELDISNSNWGGGEREEWN